MSSSKLYTTYSCIKFLFFISNFKMFFLPIETFVWHYMLTSSVLMMNDVIVHMGSSWLPLSLFIGVFVLLIQMASFICRVLLFGSLSIVFAPSPSLMWFSVVAWSVWVDLLKLDIKLFPAPCVFLTVHVVYVLPVFVLSCFQQSPYLSNIPGTTVLAWYLVRQLTLFCKLYLVLWLSQQVPEGGVGTHGCHNSILLHYLVYCFWDFPHIWDN